MQKFSYHTHTNALGIFDGRCTAEQMIEQAQKSVIRKSVFPTIWFIIPT